MREWRTEGDKCWVKTNQYSTSFVIRERKTTTEIPLHISKWIHFFKMTVSIAGENKEQQEFSFIDGSDAKMVQTLEFGS